MHNWMFHVLHVVHRRVRLMRYEDMIADPYAKLAEIRTFLDLPAAEQSFLQVVDGATVAQVGPSHSIAGNPMRFTNGQLTLRTDSAWRTEAPTARPTLKIALLTWPGRLRYGYLDRPAREHGQHSKGHHVVSPTVSVVVPTRDRPELLRDHDRVDPRPGLPG